MAATLKIEKREGRGKNEARRLRASGRIPAVLYGAEKGKAVEIAVDPKALLRILHSESGVNTLIGLEGLSDTVRDARVMVRNTNSIRSTTSCSTPTCTRSRWTRRSPSPSRFS